MALIQPAAPASYLRSRKAWVRALRQSAVAGLAPAQLRSGAVALVLARQTPAGPILMRAGSPAPASAVAAS